MVDNFLMVCYCVFFSCSSAGRAGPGGGATSEQVKVKKEPGTEDSYTCTASSMKTDAGRSACMV